MTISDLLWYPVFWLLIWAVGVLAFCAVDAISCFIFSDEQRAFYRRALTSYKQNDITLAEVMLLFAVVLRALLWQFFFVFMVLDGFLHLWRLIQYWRRPSLLVPPDDAVPIPVSVGEPPPVPILVTDNYDPDETKLAEFKDLQRRSASDREE